jgi:hypothetical protein
MSTTAPTIERWHQIARSRSSAGLADLIAEDAVFESPVVHTPQRGRAITVKYLTAALHVLGNDSFKYLNEWQAPNSAVLEFEAICEGITINGVDMIEWNAAGQITRFKVMVRPLKAVNKLHELMARMLQAGAG